jgi:GH35 family endo-1,4-beta-xylanase
MKGFSLFLALLLLLSSCKQVPPPIQDPDVFDSFAHLQEVPTSARIGSRIHHGRHYGSEIDGVIHDLSPEQAYSRIAAEEFNLGQVTWYPAWDSWNYGAPHNFQPVNAVINWCREQEQEVMLHMLVGPDDYMPAWFVEGEWSEGEMDSLLQDLIAQLVLTNDNHQKVAVWNVANEVLENGGKYREMKWNKLGWEEDRSGLSGSDQLNERHPRFIGLALQYLRQHTEARLEIRDYLIERTNLLWRKKHKAFYQLLLHLQNSGYPLDAVGIQGHYEIGKVKGLLGELESSIQKFQELGLEVYLTELDIAAREGANWSEALAEQQQADYYQVVRTALELASARFPSGVFATATIPTGLAINILSSSIKTTCPNPPTWG